MADIGSTLREKRIREKIDIGKVEEATKIRAKYLRALEHEEWNVLPGPAYAKSFLRSYAEFLGLDAHMVVEQYRAQFERPEDLELPAFARKEPLGGRVRPPGPPSRAAVFIALGAALLVVLFVLGITGGDDDGERREPARAEGESSQPRTGGTAAADGEHRSRRAPSAKSEVAVTVVASRDVWVCLVDAKGRSRIEGRTLAGGEREGPFRSRRFEVTLGNGGGDLRVDGRRRDVPDSAVPLGYVISASGTRPLPAERRPTCGPGGERGGSSPETTGEAGAVERDNL